MPCNIRVSSVDSSLNTYIQHVIGNKLDTPAGNSVVSLIKALVAVIDFPGDVWFVNPDAAEPDGESWDTGFNTIYDAHDAAAVGDKIRVLGGRYYDEVGGLSVTKAVGIESVGPPNSKAILTNSTTTGDDDGFVLEITTGAAITNFRITKGEAVSSGARGVLLNGAIGARLIHCVVLIPANDTHIGLHAVNSFGCGMTSTTPVDSIVFGVVGSGLGTGIYFESGGTNFLDATGVGVVTTGIRFGGSTTLCSVGPRCVIQNCDVGAIFDFGTTLNFLRTKPLVTGTADVINNSGNDTNTIVGDLEHHENVSPWPDGQGNLSGKAPVTLSNLTTDGAGGTESNQWYWGDLSVLIDIDEITTQWKCIGLNLSAITYNKDIYIETFFTHGDLVSSRDGGNLWDENETDLTVEDGTVYQDGDIVWVTGDDRPAGEIMLVDGVPAGDVVTLEREATADGEGGLRYTYTTGTPKMYVLKRIVVATGASLALYNAYNDFWSAASARATARHVWSKSKLISGGSAWLARIQNGTDDLDMEVSVLPITEKK